MALQPCSTVLRTSSARWQAPRLLCCHGWYGGATPQPQRGTGACSTTWAPGWEFSRASRVPHSTYPTNAARNSGSSGRAASSAARLISEAKLPDDPEFRAAFVGYLEWGTRLARQNSQPGADVVRQAPVPRWGWGEAPPYQG